MTRGHTNPFRRLDAHALVRRQHAIQKGCFYVVLTQMQALCQGNHQDEADGRCMCDRRIGKIVVAAKFLSVATDDKSCFVS